MKEPKEIDRVYAMTIVVALPGTKDQVYWFGRIDQRDEMRPLKIIASNGQDAWKAVESHYLQAFLDGAEWGEAK